MGNEKNKSPQYYAYADFEFTCSKKIKEFQDKAHINEIISFGIVITENYNIVDKFYRTIKPIYNPTLTPFCKELTHLTQKEINESKNFVEVLQEAVQFLKRYNPLQIFVFGSQDKENVKREVYWHRKELSDVANKDGQWLVNRLNNIQYNICNRILGEQMLMSLADCKMLLNIAGEVEHNALHDAIDLSEVDYYSRHRYVSTSIRKEYIEKKKEDMRYKQMRRVKQENFTCATDKDKTMFFLIREVAEYITEKNKKDKAIEELKAKAIVDDLLALIEEK